MLEVHIMHKLQASAIPFTQLCHIVFYKHSCTKMAQEVETIENAYPKWIVCSSVNGTNCMPRTLLCKCGLKDQLSVF